MRNTRTNKDFAPYLNILALKNGALLEQLIYAHKSAFSHLLVPELTRKLS